MSASARGWGGWLLHSFPKPTSIEAFDGWRADTSQWLPVAIDMRAAIPSPVAILTCSRWGRISSSRSISGSILFSPMLWHQFESECAALARLHGGLSIPVRQILIEGERSGAALPSHEPDERRQRQRGLGLAPRGSTGERSHPSARSLRKCNGFPWETYLSSSLNGSNSFPSKSEAAGPDRTFALAAKISGRAGPFPSGRRDAHSPNAAPVILTGEYNLENIFLEEYSGRFQGERRSCIALAGYDASSSSVQQSGRADTH
jgi:hypothetical protein